MHLLIIVLLICGAVCFLLSALNIPALGTTPPPRPQTLGLGLLFWIVATIVPILARANMVILCAFLIVGCSRCSTTGPNAATNERNAGINAAGSAALKDAGAILGNAITSSLVEKVQSDIGGSSKNVDLAHSASAAVWSQVNSQNIFGGIKDAISAFSSGKLNQTAIEAQKDADSAIANGHSPASVANAVATVISTVAGAPPGK